MFNRKKIRENKILIEFIADEIGDIKQELEQMNKDINKNNVDMLILNEQISKNTDDINIIKNILEIHNSKMMNWEKEKQN